MQRLLLCVFAMLSASSAAMAHSYQQGTIQIGHIWARATASGAKTAAVFVPLLNKGKEADKLLGASTPVAESAMIHETKTENGISSMTMLADVPLFPGQPVAMRPGGKHIMLMGLNRTLTKGEIFPLTLQFEKAGSVAVDVMVQTAGAKSGDHQ